MKHRIKRITDKSSISVELTKVINDPDMMKKIVKKEMALRISYKILEEMENYLIREENPSFNCEDLKAELVVMPLSDWLHIYRFLELSNFQFDKFEFKK